MVFLTVPRKILCCICKMKDDVDNLCGPGSCNIKGTWCENQEPWSRMQEQVLKVLERGKVDDSSLLTHIPGRTVTNIKTSVLAQELSSTAATFTISDYLKQLIKQKARELLDVNGDDKGQLENLYLRARVPEASLQEKISEAEKKTLEVAIQNDSPAQLSDKSTDETSKELVDTSTPSRIGRGGRAIAKATMSSGDQHSIPQLDNEDQTRRKLPESVKPQRHQFAQSLTKGKLLYQLLKIKPPVKNDQSELSGIYSETLLNDLSSDIMSLGKYLEPHKTSLSAPSQKDHYQQASHFKDEVNKQLMPLISSTPLRELMSHIIHVMKKECMEPTTQMTCSEVSSRTGLLLKLISDRLSKNGSNMTTTSSRQLKKPSKEEASHGVAEDGSKKILWAILVTVSMATIIAVTCMIGILFLRSVARHDLEGRFFNRPMVEDEENPRIDYFVRNTAPLQDSFETVDETINTVMVGNLHTYKTLEE